MKMLLLVATVHLLILHQYRKDKKEVLAPKRNSQVKEIVPINSQDYLVRGIRLNSSDSSRISYQVNKGSYYFLNYAGR